MAAGVTRLSPRATPGRAYATFAAKDTMSWTSVGCPILYTAANWNNVSFYYEVCMRATTGTAETRLYDETLAASVGSSGSTTTSATLVRLRSAALTLTDGSTYRSQFGASGGDAGETKGAALIAVKT